MNNDSLKREQFSYYYGNDRLDSKQIILDLVLSDRLLDTEVKVQFKVDTGAVDIAFNASVLEINQTEEQFISTHDVVKVQRFGIARNVPLTYYRYIMPIIKFGSFILHNFPVYITFNEVGKSKLIGMSLLRLFKISIQPEYKSIEFTETEELARYTHNNKSMHNIDRVEPETYIDFGEETLIEANYINQLTKFSSNFKTKGDQHNAN